MSISFRATPVPMPNTSVKPIRAHDTAGEALWESRSSPVTLSFELTLRAFFIVFLILNIVYVIRKGKNEKI